MIRANFNRDPSTLEIEEFARLSADAIWLENFRLERQQHAQATLILDLLKVLRT